jgi:hypothetical protein
LISTALAVLVPRPVLSSDARIVNLSLWLNDFFECKSVFDPIAKIVDVLELITRFQPQAGDMHIRAGPSAKGVHFAYIDFPEPSTLPTTDPLPEAPQVIEGIMLKGIA